MSEKEKTAGKTIFSESFVGAVFEEDDFDGAVFKEDNLYCVAITESNLDQTRIEESSMHNVQFRNMGMRNASFQAVDLRGISFLPVDIYKSDPFRFVVEGDGIRMPFIAVAGLGDSVATALAEARKESRFSTQEDIKNVSGVSKSIVEAMDRLGAFAGIPKSSQLTFF